MAVALLVVTLLPSLSHVARAAGGIVVSPTRADVTVNEGEQTSEVITVRNETRDTTAVRIYVMDFSVGSEDTIQFSSPGHESYSASQWLSADTSEFELHEGESRDVEVTVAVPAEVEPGGHYAAVFFETEPSTTEEGVSIATRLPTLFYITVPGKTEQDVVADAEIVSIVLPRVVDGGPVDVGVVVHNCGNVHLTMAAKAYFDCSVGSSAELDLGQMTILPDDEASFEAAWDEVPFIGRVEARLVVGYFDQDGELVNEDRVGHFTVVPWQELVTIAVAIGLLVTIALVFYRSYANRPS